MVFKTSNFKLQTSTIAQAALSERSESNGQTSDKLQTSDLKLVWNLLLGYTLVFGVWSLNFERPKGAF